MKKIFLLIFALLFCVFVVGCGEKEDNGTYSARPAKRTTSAIVFEEGEKPQVEIKLSNGKSIKLELYPDIAPITVKNFVSLAEAGFYDGTIFHRVIENFMIQGGGYTYTGHGTSKAAIKEKDCDTIFGEFSLNNFKNDLKHEAGVISMARRSGDNNSASSQFFICVTDYPSLNGQYAAFGRTIDTESLNNAIEISKKSTTSVIISGTKFDDFLSQPIYIESIRRIDK